MVRLLAFLLVFLNHTLPSGPDPRIDHMLKGFAPIFHSFALACKSGLSLFFTLSAFLICELLLREREAAGAVAVKQFYIRRILRIWPLYYFGLAFGLALALLPAYHGNQHSDVVSIGWMAIFMGAWYMTASNALTGPAFPLWSISVEEQFYLVAPWVVKYFSRKWLYGFCLVIILVANAWLYYLGSVRAGYNAIWWNSFVQFECFAAGIFLCLTLRGRIPRLSLWQRTALLVCSGSFWFFACYTLLHGCVSGAGANPGSWPLIAANGLTALGSALVLLAFLGVDAKFLPGWAIYLGRISFGLYVYHEFALYITTHFLFGHVASVASAAYFLKAVATIGLTVLMAAISYRYFETPFLRMKKRHSVIESQPILSDN